MHGQGLLEAAKECHKLSAFLDPSRPEPLLSLGDIYRQQGFLAEAEASIRVSLDVAPSWHLAHFNLGNTLKSMGRHEAAINEYKEALKLRPPFRAAVLNNMAISYGAINRNDEVLDCYQEVMFMLLPTAR